MQGERARVGPTGGYVRKYRPVSRCRCPLIKKDRPVAAAAARIGASWSSSTCTTHGRYRVERPKLASPSLGQLLFRSVPSVASPLSLSLFSSRSFVCLFSRLPLAPAIYQGRAEGSRLAQGSASPSSPTPSCLSVRSATTPPPADRLPPLAIAAARSSFLERAVQLQRGKVYLRLEISFMLLLLLVLDC
jgi:hypothetical protein